MLCQWLLVEAIITISRRWHKYDFGALVEKWVMAISVGVIWGTINTQLFFPFSYSYFVNIGWSWYGNITNLLLDWQFWMLNFVLVGIEANKMNWNFWRCIGVRLAIYPNQITVNPSRHTPEYTQHKSTKWKLGTLFQYKSVFLLCSVFASLASNEGAIC